MTKFMLSWRKSTNERFHLETLTTDDLAESLRERFRKTVGRPWTKPITASLHSMADGPRGGFFHVWGRNVVFGSWWPVEEGDPE